MDLTFHFFGRLRERRGTSEERHPFVAGKDLAQWYDGFHLGCDRAAVAVAVNDDLVAWSTPVQPGDRVAFLPPVSGG